MRAGAQRFRIGAQSTIYAQWRNACSGGRPEGHMDRKRELSDRARAVIVQLAAQYPACFHVYQWRRRPLAIGISALISVANVSDEDLKRALSFYTWNEAYLKACSVGAARIGLDGQSVGLVSESEAAFAANKLAGVRKREKQRRK